MRRRVSSAVATTRAREAVSCARCSSFAIAVATRSVNEARRASVSGASARSLVELAIMTPHRRSWTMIGVPTPERTPAGRMTAIASPGACAVLAIRAGRRVCQTIAIRFSPPSLGRSPMGRTSPVLLHPATMVAVSSDS